RFADGTYDAGKISVLYVSPLKALNEDIRRNLNLPIEGIRAQFQKAGIPFPNIRAQTRSGDTPQAERRRLLSMPPSILALTPESLGILLLNPKGRALLSSVRYVILDEIHAALGSKRGCYLSCQIDRLALVAGEFQRVALSATVKPVEMAAEFAGGLRKSPSGSGYEKRTVRIVFPKDKKDIEFQVLFPGNDEDAGGDAQKDDPPAQYGKRYTQLIKFIQERIQNCGERSASGSVLVFADSRRRVERIAYLLNQAAADGDSADRPLAYVHHGSLSKDVRREVEKALAAGEISCVAATGSLELGIDIGSIKEVILAGSPGSSAQALQRVGRGGHEVGMTSRGWLLPFTGMDLLQAAALSAAVEDREIEETAGIKNPLDILAQIILALCAEKDWNEDDLFETIRGFYVYQNLSRKNYDGVVRMLAGGYEETRLRELKRRIYRDDAEKTLRAAPGLLPLLYTSGGVIATKGYYSLRLASNKTPTKTGAIGTKIGELDEEFVWERRVGDCFDFGGRSWKITAIGNEAVEALPFPGGAGSAPFWKGDMAYRDNILSRRMLEILDGHNETQKQETVKFAGFSPEAETALANFLRSQQSAQGKVPLPSPSFIPIEIIDDPSSRADAYIVIFYTFRGGGINFPLSLAIAQDIEAACGMRVEGTANDNAVFARLPRSITADPASIILESLRRICRGKEGEQRFCQRFESSGVFGGAFREAAERALILPRAPFGKRTPLWVMRQRSKRLFDAVSSYRDFPAAAEAWRTCLNDQFDMEGFSSLLEHIETREISVGFFKTRQGSPFSQELSWAETNALMYTYDERPDLLGHPSGRDAGASLSDQVIAEALGNARARPPLSHELIADFCSRLRREAAGWASEDSLTLCEWVKERIAIPTNGKDEEWEKLLEYVPFELA
ncbi:MAG: DEAD/DEAH box helicase, partial [Treponema sp.]|nr:DEAD/DEAH box helicase [Treponema sp.]